MLCQHLLAELIVASRTVELAQEAKDEADASLIAAERYLAQIGSEYAACILEAGTGGQGDPGQGAPTP